MSTPLFEPADVTAELAALRASIEESSGAPPVASPQFANYAPAISTEGWPEPLPLADPLPPFPVGALPGVLGDFVGAVAESTQAPADLPAALALAVLATATQKVVKLQIRSDYTETLSVFVAAVLQPSERKSAVEALVTAPLRGYEAEQQVQAAPQVAASRRKLDVLRKRHQRLTTALSKAEDESPTLEKNLADVEQAIANTERMVLPRLIADDTTPERLVEMMYEQGGRMGLFSSEGGVLEQMNRRRGNTSGLDTYLKAYGGDSLAVDRKSGTRVSIAKPALTIGVAVQPGVVRNLARMDSARERGLLSRILYFFPAPRAGKRDVLVDPVPEDIRSAYGRMVRRQLDVRIVRDRGEIVAHPLTLSDGAYDRFLAFAESIEPRVGPGGDLELCGWGGKLPGQMLRIAALLHLSRSHMTIPVEPEAVDAAISIAHYLIPHAQAAFGLMSVDPRIEDALHIAQTMLSKGIGEISQHGLTELVKGRVKPVPRFESAMELLVQHGFMRRREDSTPHKRGPKPIIWTLNPRVGPQHFSRGDWA